MPGARKRGGPPASQQSLFPGWSAPPPSDDNPDSPLAALPPIDASTTLAGLALPYRSYLLLHDHTEHTVDCFLSDLRLLTRFVGSDMPVGAVTRDRIVDWLMHLRWDSSERPAPKTMARRVTFLKNFFGWLAEEQVLPENLAAKLAFSRPLPPLPELLFENEIERLVAAANDSRSALLIMLALDAGLKKEEILQLAPEHIDTSDPERPTVAVRLAGPARRQRERMLALSSDFTPVYERYLHDYRPQGPLFNCTDRNLTYILARVAKRARLTKRVTLQLLRDCFAVRELRNGLPLPMLREKLGLSDEAWYEAQEKYRKLAFPV
jgi:site-specific recombinase XerD